MKRVKLVFALAVLFGCADDNDLGGLEMTVAEVISVNGIPYEEIEIGIFPTEALVTNDFSRNGAIVYKRLINGSTRFNGILPDTYLAGVIVTAFPQAGSHKLVQIKPGKLTKVELID